MFGLCDGNNFYVSCERVFRPNMVGRPVVVLSSNDGACIARSNEAKELGIKMAQPWFQVKHLERSAGLIAVSANFELYNEMSGRMHAVAGRYAPRQEVYSIDESFLDFEGIAGNLVEIGRDLRAAVLRETGIPTSIGFGSTKTLAKLANHVGKTADRKPGSYPSSLAQVCNLGELTPQELAAIFASTEVGSVWGVGKKIGAALTESGVRTVLDLVRADVSMVRKRFSVVMEKTVLELRGTSCLEMADVNDPATSKQQILVSRSFGKSVTEVNGMVEAVSEFASRAAEKLRHQESAAAAIHVFFMTSPFRKDDRQHSPSATVPLGRPTSDTGTLVSAAVGAVERLFRPGFNYAKAGVTLINLQPASQVDQQGELDLFSATADAVATPSHSPQRDRSALMEAMDHLNRRFGRDSVRIGSATLASGTGRSASGKSADQASHEAKRTVEVRSWATRQDRRSPRYTTRWEEMPVVKA